MSILIRGINMPTSCAECFAREISGASAGVSLCRISSRELDFDYDERRMKFCPLVPVPPHGRLIDADALKDNDDIIHKYMLFGGQVVYSQGAIDYAPTIIPASEEGET